MRAWLLRILSLSLFTSLCEIFLPEGTVRKFAAPLLSLTVSAAIFLPIISFLSSPPALSFPLPGEESAAVSTLSSSVAAEYESRIAAAISARGGKVLEIETGEDFSIRRIVLEEEGSLSAMHYIFTELEVAREDVEIRKN